MELKPKVYRIFIRRLVPMFKYCKKCVGIRQFKHDAGDISNNKPRHCDVCGGEE